MSVIVYSGLTLALLLNVLFFSIKFKNWNKSEIVGNIKKPRSPKDDEEFRIQLSQIATRLEESFLNEKIFSNPELTIGDLANDMGTNRTYISAAINYVYNKNFCSFVNHFRFSALQEMLKEDEFCTNRELAIKCGFGSIDSMKRVVKLNTGMGITEWKESLKESINEPTI